MLSVSRTPDKSRRIRMHRKTTPPPAHRGPTDLSDDEEHYETSGSVDEYEPARRVRVREKTRPRPGKEMLPRANQYLDNAGRLVDSLFYSFYASPPPGASTPHLKSYQMILPVVGGPYERKELRYQFFCSSTGSGKTFAMLYAVWSYASASPIGTKLFIVAPSKARENVLKEFCNERLPIEGLRRYISYMVTEKDRNAVLGAVPVDDDGGGSGGVYRSVKRAISKLNIYVISPVQFMNNIAKGTSPSSDAYPLHKSPEKCCVFFDEVHLLNDVNLIEDRSMLAKTPQGLTAVARKVRQVITDHRLYAFHGFSWTPMTTGPNDFVSLMGMMKGSKWCKDELNESLYDPEEVYSPGAPSTDYYFTAREMPDDLIDSSKASKCHLLKKDRRLWYKPQTLHYDMTPVQKDRILRLFKNNLFYLDATINTNRAKAADTEYDDPPPLSVAKDPRMERLFSARDPAYLASIMDRLGFRLKTTDANVIKFFDRLSLDDKSFVLRELFFFLVRPNEPPPVVTPAKLASVVKSAVVDESTDLSSSRTNPLLYSVFGLLPVTARHHQIAPRELALWGAATDGGFATVIRKTIVASPPEIVMGRIRNTVEFAEPAKTSLFPQYNLINTSSYLNHVLKQVAPGKKLKSSQSLKDVLSMDGIDAREFLAALCPKYVAMLDDLKADIRGTSVGKNGVLYLPLQWGKAPFLSLLKEIARLLNDNLPWSPATPLTPGDEARRFTVALDGKDTARELSFFTAQCTASTGNLLILTERFWQSVDIQNANAIYYADSFMPAQLDQIIGRVHRLNAQKTYQRPWMLEVVKLSTFGSIDDAKEDMSFLACQTVYDEIYKQAFGVEKDIRELAKRATWGCKAMKALSRPNSSGDLVGFERGIVCA